ncbi:HTH-type transcriptional regulatory protein GabR [Pandoraea pneumonica]|uniref:HTH-type transcriptional regulatory protein GabR n=1 Tax=Pandoraea pneumonica TaxID=2508299 RepID=A0A5E4RZQ6_9BURK|nr:PLP-dependent aminotransferase family protein [Pandoraea pneumonica]VVD68940.1 HTH-type transcriptional regulatory protein GabR [Pandoraea pneumonica]
MELHELTPSRAQDAPIYLQLYRRYRDAIVSGKLRPGERAPSVRSLASELNLARGTVELAYQMLTSEGYFTARGAAGTFVSPRLESLGEATPTIAVPSVTVAAPPSTPATAMPRPFQLGLPALDAFPRKTWSRLASRNARAMDTAALIYPDITGYDPLRRAIATYLGISRGIACTHEQVFVTAGHLGTLELVCRALLRPGDTGWYEDPGYLFARHFLERAGMQLTPVPVDEEGLDVAAGRKRAANARFAVLTPTHQSPTGVTLSLPRRLELLEWAGQHDAWIVEDDYDSEFRYHGRPLPALKSLDRDDRVLYTGTFSKVLFPGLRLAYLVVPASQIDRFREAARHLPGPGSILLQATVADFMAQGHFARHLRKMRALYAERRGFLVEALAQAFDGELKVAPQAGGIHALASLPRGRDDKALAAAAQQQGLAVQAVSQWQMRRASGAGLAARSGLLLGFTNIVSGDMATRLCEQLLAATRDA